VIYSATGTTKETLTGDVSRKMASKVEADTAGETKLSFGSDYTERHSGHRTIVVGTGSAHRTGVLHIEGNGRAYASQTMEIEVLKGLTLICGDSQILVSPKGITLASPNISFVGTAVGATAGTFAVTATDSVSLKGPTATVQTAGAKLALDSSSANLIAPAVKLGSGSGEAASTSASKQTITRVQMKDAQGKPRANSRVLLLKGGPKGEQRMTVLDEDGMLELIGDDSYQSVFPDDPAAK
jgi:hypothetical protein